MRVFFLFLALSFVSAFPLCATADDFDTQAQISAMAARLGVEERFMPGSRDLHAWFETQDSAYVEALKGLLHGNLENRGQVRLLLKTAKEGVFTLDELKRAVPHIASHTYIHLVLSCAREGNDAYTAACASLLRGFIADSTQEGAVIQGKLGKSFFRDENAQIFLDQVKTHFPGRLEAVAKCSFRTFQMQLLMPYAADVGDDDLLLLRRLLRASCGEERYDKKGFLCSGDYESVTRVLTFFVAADKAHVSRVLALGCDSGVTWGLLRSGAALTDAQLQQVSILAQDVHDTVDLCGAIRHMSDDQIQSFTSLPKHVRHYFLQLGQFTPSQEDIDGICRVYDGCDEAQIGDIFIEMYDKTPTQEELATLLSLAPEPSLRAAALMCKDWLSLVAPNPLRVTLFKTLALGCDDHSLSTICYSLKGYQTDAHLSCLREILDLSLPPDKRAFLVRKLRGDLCPPIPQEALPLIVQLMERYDLEQVESLCDCAIGLCNCEREGSVDPVAFLKARCQEGASGASASSGQCA